MNMFINPSCQIIHILAVEKTPPALNSTIHIIFPFLIAELKEEISNTVLVSLAHKIVKKNLESRNLSSSLQQEKNRSPEDWPRKHLNHRCLHCQHQMISFQVY